VLLDYFQFLLSEVLFIKNWVPDAMSKWRTEPSVQCALGKWVPHTTCVQGISLVPPSHAVHLRPELGAPELSQSLGTVAVKITPGLPQIIINKLII
jgi:hypothetical protein